MAGPGEARDDPVAALTNLAARLAAALEDAETHLATARALIAALDDPAGLAGWDGAAKDACYRALICQPRCAARPLIFAHEAASRMTSGDTTGPPRLAAEVAPVLRAVLAGDPAGTPGYKNAVVTLLTLRAVLGEGFPPGEIPALHRDWFEAFDPEDLALPYSVMFNPALFGQNRDEVLGRYLRPAPRMDAVLRLPPAHVLFLEWLSGQSLFSAPDNGDLAGYLTALPPPTPQNRAAARSLVLRHWRPGGALGAERLAALGLGEDMDGMAARAAGFRAEVAAAATGGAAPDLHRKLRQAAAAGWTIATRPLPFLNSGQRRVRLAVCLSGQLRGYEAALASWRQTLLTHVDATFFIHSWRNVGRSDAKPFRYVLPFAGRSFPETYRQIALAAGYEAMRDRYPTLFRALADGARVDEVGLSALYDTDHVILEDDGDAAFAAFSNQDKMHYKIAAADRMAQEAGGFDLHLRLRPDLATRLRAFDWRDMAVACRARPVLYAEKPPGLHYGVLMQGDQFALATPATMQAYAGAWDRLPPFARAGFAGCPPAFTGHTSLAFGAWMQGIAVERAPVKFGTLQEARPMASAEILAALEEDSRGDAPDLRLIAAARADLG
jgi:hypothetical protein